MVGFANGEINKVKKGVEELTRLIKFLQQDISLLMFDISMQLPVKTQKTKGFMRKDEQLKVELERRRDKSRRIVDEDTVKKSEKILTDIQIMESSLTQMPSSDVYTRWYTKLLIFIPFTIIVAGAFLSATSYLIFCKQSHSDE